ncbi:hypothetical protein K450DRAFT_207459 [Umbelopsis ramanniana AG]|uniref:Uncharacterized protein n=1 Tax=Umbelopsis ramanniana AG TaxID=1314678 RepID=A0AAD5HGC1_UMBRA|nr:uncharacterized protein K450DRAFT_207459 [Umbelopsis ramanniana AG]KAI8581596.1 hypothetical protein K450DRAFT_207459 [Umbelopsis ramanniana AG]
MVDKDPSPEPASTSSIADGENAMATDDSSEQFHVQGRNTRRMSFTDTSKSAKVRYRNSASLSPSLNRRRMPPSSPNLNVTGGTALLSPKEMTRLAPYTSNSFDMLDSIVDYQDGYGPAPVNSSSTPAQLSKKKKKHKSNKSTQFTPPQSPVAQQRRRSLTPVDQNVSYRQPLSPNAQPRRMENFQAKQYSTNKRRSLISRSSDDYKNSTDSILNENKENRAPSVVSGNSSSNEQKPSHKDKGEARAKISKEEDVKDLPESKPSFSIWDYLKDELTASDFDSAQDLKRERVTNLLGVPGAVEKLMSFGQLVCLDSFLYTFTILPLRFFFALVRFFDVSFWNIVNIRTLDRRHLKPSQKCDLLKGLLLILTYLAMRTLDASRMYHSIRGQAVLKLYVIFNVLEICDKLCCSIGSDILDALFSKTTLGNYRGQQTSGESISAKRHLRPVTFFLLALTYMILHTLVLFIQMITLNVAINFYSNALLTLLISNQFVEIKQSVFKKFEKENLFQLSCSDIVERFQQGMFLLIITLRNVIELSESPPSPFSILPSTFVPLFKLPTTTTLDTLMTPVIMVILSELIVDWLKHAFITKFNQIRPSIYSKYIDILCRDLVVGSPGRMSGKKAIFVDQAPMVSRRIGFPALPMACLMTLIVQQLIPMLFSASPTSSMDNGGTKVSTYLVESIATFLVDYCGKWLIAIGSMAKIDIIGLVQSILFRGGALDKALQQFIWLGAWILGIIVTGLCLIALKVLVGINLLGYAYKRYASMQAREEEERKKDELYAEMDKDEKAYKSSVHKYLNDENDNVLGVPQQKYTLDNVDRFSMVKSRIP